MATKMTSSPVDPSRRSAEESEAAVRRVRDDYTRIAQNGGVDKPATCCGDTDSSPSGRYGYRLEEIRSLPDGADMGLGCGAPLAALELEPGERVLDLGSGGGIDVFLAAKQVGSAGRVIGVDMTSAMIDLARENAVRGGYDNVEFLQGRLEALPVPDRSIDAVTSNCVINLVPDKGKVYEEIARVLRPGGRVVVSDIVLERALPQALLRELDAGSCIITAIKREAYLDQVREAGLVDLQLLSDVDYLVAAGWTTHEALNDESRALLDRAGISFEEIRGTIRSITLRARRPER